MLKESYCPICGKEFYPTIHWVYRDENYRYCSWTCFRKRTEILGSTKYRPVEQVNTDGIVVRVHKNLNQACEFIEGSYNGIQTALKAGRVYKGFTWRYKENAVSKM